MEYPVIADLNADGETEILCSCNNGATTSLNAFNSANLPWRRARSIWNQFNYFVVNINDGGKVPQQQQTHNHDLLNLDMNNFLAQQPVQTFEAPDVDITVDDVFCGPEGIEVTLTFCNTGDATFPMGQSIVFYNQDPTTTSTGISIINSFPLTDAPIAPGDCHTQTVSIPSGSVYGEVYVTINIHESTLLPMVLDFNSIETSVGECDYTNNITSFLPYCCFANTDSNYTNIGTDWEITQNTTLVGKYYVAPNVTLSLIHI